MHIWIFSFNNQNLALQGPALLAPYTSVVVRRSAFLDLINKHTIHAAFSQALVQMINLINRGMRPGSLRISRIEFDEMRNSFQRWISNQWHKCRQMISSTRVENNGVLRIDFKECLQAFVTMQGTDIFSIRKTTSGFYFVIVGHDPSSH